MKHDLTVEINSVEALSKEIRIRSEKINEIINELQEATNEMESFFDTPTGKTTKEYLLQYLNEAKKPCRALDNLSYKINLFYINYLELYNVTKQSVGGNQ